MKHPKGGVTKAKPVAPRRKATHRDDRPKKRKTKTTIDFLVETIEDVYLYEGNLAVRYSWLNEKGVEDQNTSDDIFGFAVNTYKEYFVNSFEEKADFVVKEELRQAVISKLNFDPESLTTLPEDYEERKAAANREELLWEARLDELAQELRIKQRAGTPLPVDIVPPLDGACERNLAVDESVVGSDEEEGVVEGDSDENFEMDTDSQTEWSGQDDYEQMGIPPADHNPHDLSDFSSSPQRITSHFLPLRNRLNNSSSINGEAAQNGDTETPTEFGNIGSDADENEEMTTETVDEEMELDGQVIGRNDAIKGLPANEDQIKDQEVKRIDDTAQMGTKKAHGGKKKDKSSSHGDVRCSSRSTKYKGKYVFEMRDKDDQESRFLKSDRVLMKLAGYRHPCCWAWAVSRANFESAKVGKSKILDADDGLLLTRDVEANTFIANYDGPYGSEAQLEEKNPVKTHYFLVDGYGYDGHPKHGELNGLASMANHSRERYNTHAKFYHKTCDGNCPALGVFLKTIRPMKEGTEILWNYGFYLSQKACDDCIAKKLQDLCENCKIYEFLRN